MNKFASKRRFTICVVKKTTRSQSQFLFLSFFRSSANSFKRMMTFLPRHSILPGPDSRRRSFIRLQFWSITLTWRKLLNNPHHVLLLPALSPILLEEEERDEDYLAISAKSTYLTDNLSGIMSSHATVSASYLYCFACLSMLQCELSPTPFLFSLDFCSVISIRFLTVNGFSKHHGNLQCIL